MIKQRIQNIPLWKKALWLTLILIYISEIGRILVAIPFSIVNVAINGPDAVLSDDITELTQIIYRGIEALLFAYLIRRNTLREFKEEKFDIKVLLFIGLSLGYAAVFYVVTKAEVTEFTPVHYLRTLLFAPICEELMYRGALQRTLKELGGVKFSIAVTAILFALAHMELKQSLFALPLGILLGYVGEYYSLKCSILVHAFANLISVINRFYPQAIPVIAGVGMVYFVGIAVWKRKVIIAFLKEKTEEGNYRKVMVNIPMIILYLTAIICFIGAFLK